MHKKYMYKHICIRKVLYIYITYIYIYIYLLNNIIYM